MNFSRTFPKALLVFLLLLIITTAFAAPANAAWPWEGKFWDPCHGLIGGLFCGTLDQVAIDIIKGLAGLINGLILFIAGLFLWLANQLIGVALDLNNGLAMGKESIINTGHKIVLGVANMGFIVALVVIAFGTMLRWEGFNYKKALPRVIIAALLINFGFFIVTNWLISPVNQITEAFRAASSFDPTNSFAVFKDAVGIGGVADQQIGEVARTSASSSDIASKNIVGVAAKSIASVLFTAIFSFLGFLALMAFASMLFIRYIALAILIILLPLAWIAWIFPNIKIPGGGNPWSMWWESFTRWLLFAPFAMFFFYLATQLANKGFIPPTNATFGEYLGGMILIVGLLLGGLLVSNKIGISGGAMALGAAAAGKVWVQARVKKYGLKAGRGTIRKALPRERLQKLENLGANKGFFGRHLAAPARAVGRQAVKGDAAITKAREAEFLKKTENLAPYQKSDMYAGLKEEDRAYMLKNMIKEGYDWELVPGAREDIIKWATKKKDKDGKDIDRSSDFDRDLYGLKKAELDLVDSGISPDALRAMEPYRPRLEKAIKDGDKEEVERIKYILSLEVEEILRKDLNVVTATGMGKLQRRTFSSNVPDEKRPGKFKVGYQMFGDDETGATMADIYGASERRYIAMDRADALRRLKGSTRGDGSKNLSEAGVEGLGTLQDWFIPPLTTASGVGKVEFLGMPAPAKIALLKEHWDAVQAGAKIKITEEVERRQTDLGLSDEQAARALEIELKKAERAVPEKLVADLQQLFESSRGASHSVLAV